MDAVGRVFAIRTLKRHIDDEFDWAEIRILFHRLGKKEPDFDNSYSKSDLIIGYLNQCSDNELLNLATQCGLATPELQQSTWGESKYWLIDHFRLFISHVHTVKGSATNLKTALRRYAITSFVAHEDIVPSDEWREEILRALNSMDALAAILTPDFGGSKWTDQEIGFSVAKDVLIIPIDKGINPYGFIEKYQSLKTNKLDAFHVADAVFKTICGNAKTRGNMIDVLVKAISSGADATEASFRLQKLKEVDDGLLTSSWEKIRENVIANASLNSDEAFIEALNGILVGQKITPINLKEDAFKDLDDEIPF